MNKRKYIYKVISHFSLYKATYLNVPHREKVAYPSISIIRFKRSNSEAPGNNGKPRNNSATMHPKDHISIAVVYLIRVKD